jgi:RNA polymerase sigma-70 factor (ECF subfamily)
MPRRLTKKARDGTIGGGAGDFPVTSWGLVAGLADASPENRRQALERLCRSYWKPVYHYVRKAWSKSSDDAKDLTQAFFLQLIEKDYLSRFKPERGGFRPYLKMLLRGFSACQHDALQALKRGGGVKLVPLEGSAVPLKELLADPRSEDPERMLDWAWKKEVLERALERTRRWFSAVDRTLQYRVFEVYDLGGAELRPTYAQLSERLGIKETDVRNHLFTVRERLRAEVRAELAQTVTDLDGLDAEWNDLFQA